MREASETPALTWTRSTYCNNTSCVEVAQDHESILVRDAKHPEQPALRFTHDEWSAFLTGVRAGEFDAS